MRFLAERLEHGVPAARADARGADPPALPRARAARPARAAVAAAGRSSSPTTRSTSGPPSWSSTVGTDRRAGDPARPAAGRARSPTMAPRRRARGRRRPLPGLAGRAGVAGARPRPRSRSCSAALPFAHRRTPGRDRRVPGRRPAGLLLHLPARTGAGIVEDDLVRGVHPMVGRRLNLWRLRNFRITRLTRPRTCCSTTASPTDNEADQRLVALAQVRQLAVVRDAGRPGRLAAARRARHRQLPGGDPPGADGPRHERRPARHEPRLAAHLAGDRRPARRADARCSARIAPLTAGAGIEEVLAQGRHRRPGRRAAPGRRAVLLPAGLRRRRLGRSRRRPSGCSRWTTTRRRCCGPVAAARSTPTSCTRLLAGAGGTFVEHDLDDGRRAGPGRPRARAQQGRHRRRRRHHAHRAAPRGHHPRGAAAATPPRPWARWPRPSAPGSSPRSTWPSRCRCRSSGSPSRPAPGSRWTPAPRTWTGWPGR